MNLLRQLVLRHVLILVVAVPIALAATSPLLAWRDPTYILAGFSGIVAMALLFVQPLLALGVLPGLASVRGRRVHRLLGAGLAVSVLVHVGALWVTSPPDVLDALTFTSPASFSVWGVIAMWAVFATALLALFRKRLGPRFWRLLHGALTLVIAVGTVIHAVLIEGTMEPVSKTVLAVLVLFTSLWALYRIRVWTVFKSRR